ncbi:amidohydrolase family protein [Planctomicrobium sp. SH661]|uniref:amidohydrolase family protein n=1 Tax=Planctomicrobium sp. SH661 TaxID=3448124 RepID=UPI003F5B5856
MIRLRARWLFPGDGPPLRDAVITLAGEHIAAVEENSAASATDLGDVAIIPGLINAHTHLEFSHLQSPIEPRNHFANWIRGVISNRRGQAADPLLAIHQGLRESVELGVTGLAETATSDWLFDQSHREVVPRMLVFREILGLRPEGVAAQLEVAEMFLRRAEQHRFNDVGLSPHAPYSLHPQLFRGLCELAATRKVPLSMHLAESPAEIELLKSGTGPLVELFTQMGLWQPGMIPPGSRPLDYLKELARAPRALVVHGNLLDEEEIAFIASHPQMSVVYCPRTHRAMQSEVHPWRKMIASGINVTLGTDSRASNPDLSIWEELRWLQSQAPDLPASQILALSTKNAAQALGWREHGTLTPGQKANLCIIPLTKNGIGRPEEHLFEGSCTKVRIDGQLLT